MMQQKKMEKLIKTKKLIKEFEEMEFDYNKCINKQIEIINSVLHEAGNSGFSANCVIQGFMYINKSSFSEELQKVLFKK